MLVNAASDERSNAANYFDTLNNFVQCGVHSTKFNMNCPYAISYVQTVPMDVRLQTL